MASKLLNEIGSVFAIRFSREEAEGKRDRKRDAAGAARKFFQRLVSRSEAGCKGGLASLRTHLSGRPGIFGGGKKMARKGV